jgi:hypothetical protein
MVPDQLRVPSIPGPVETSAEHDSKENSLADRSLAVLLSDGSIRSRGIPLL